MRIPQEPAQRADINIVPLIDIIFCILVFFIVASLVLTRAEGLDVNRPSASEAVPRTQPAVTVSITEANEIAVNQDIVALEELVAAIEAVLAENAGEEGEDGEDGENADVSNRLVLLNADLALTHGDVVAVMNELSKLQDVTLAIAAKSTEE
ncbi:MAG: biopolymer transporter ExbD [Cyanobacteria bacterium P01_A01_bin.3]